MTYLRYRSIMKPHQPLLLSFALLLWVKKRAKTLERVSERVCRRMEKANPATARRFAADGDDEHLHGRSDAGRGRFMKDYKLKTFDESAGQMIGQELGKHLVSTCPAFLQFSWRLRKMKSLRKNRLLRTNTKSYTPTTTRTKPNSGISTSRREGKKK